MEKTTNIKNQAIRILREKYEEHKKLQKTRNRRIRRKKCLRQEIYQNTNIFESKHNLYSNMRAQNIIWEKNYELKTTINTLKDEANAVKAKVWNMEKENRKMNKLIEAWNLTPFLHSHSMKKPYINMATVEKVLADQDFSIVSIKLEIVDMQRQLQAREQRLNQIDNSNKQINRIECNYTYEAGVLRAKLLDLLLQSQLSKQQLSEGVKGKIVKLDKQLQILNKNIDLKKKSKNSLSSDLEGLNKESGIHKEVNFKEITQLKKITKEMELQEINMLHEEEHKLQVSRQERRQYDFWLQQWVDTKIETKMKLWKQINDQQELIRDLTTCPHAKESPNQSLGLQLPSEKSVTSQSAQSPVKELEKESEGDM